MKRHVNTVKAQTRLHFVPKYLYFVLISVSCYLKVLQRKNSKVMTDVVLCVQWQKYWWKCKRFCCEQPPEITGVVGFRCEADMRRLCLGSSSEFNIFTNWTKCFNISASFNFPFNVFVMVPRPQASPSPSPVGYSPMTPGAPSPGGYNPHTPGSNIEQGGSDWVTTDILVRVKDSFMDLMGQTGVIRSVTVTNTVTSSTAWHHQISHDITSVIILIRLRYEGRSVKQSVSLDPDNDSLINNLTWSMKSGNKILIVTFNRNPPSWISHGALLCQEGTVYIYIYIYTSADQFQQW